jgi:tellurite resistance protein TerC
MVVAEISMDAARVCTRRLEDVTLFPFAEYWWFYLVFTLFVLLMLALDLGVFHRKAHTVSAKEAARWSAIWVGLALTFNFLLYQYAAGTFSPEIGKELGLQFLAGFVVEYTLSVDNMFVFVVIFSFFAVPSYLQHRVLFYGILGALIFRAIFIALGSVLLSYHEVVVVFGILLMLTGVRMVWHESAQASPDRNPLVRLTRRLVPVTPDFHGKKFFTRIEGHLHATPLFLALMAIEMSDIVFAIDSVPAIFALTSEPLIVFTSNVFAILGLRSLYFLLAAAVAKFSLLRYGLAGVLIFIGLKMVWLNPLYGGHFPIVWSLAIIGTLVGGSILASLLVSRRASPEQGEGGEPPSPRRRV